VCSASHGLCNHIRICPREIILTCKRGHTHTHTIQAKHTMTTQKRLQAGSGVQGKASPAWYAVTSTGQRNMPHTAYTVGASERKVERHHFRKGQHSILKCQRGHQPPNTRACTHSRPLHSALSMYLAPLRALRVARAVHRMVQAMRSRFNLRFPVRILCASNYGHS
jgi:hypothetical protein